MGKNNLEKYEQDALKSLSIDKKIVRVFIGYSWDGKANEDEHWKNFLQPVFNRYKDKFEERFAEYGMKLSVQRLRGTHAGRVFDDILGKIASADILVFDIADRESGENSKSKSKSTPKAIFNPNVMMELGIALALKKDVFLMVRDDAFASVPSDLKGFLYTVYKKEDSNLATSRISDFRGFVAKYVWLLNKAANNKI